MIADSEKARSRERATGPSGTKLVTREDKDNVMVEARDEKSNVVVHKSYVRKN